VIGPSESLWGGLALVAGYVAFLLALVGALGVVGGWRSVAERYDAARQGRAEPPGAVRWAYGGFGWVSYNGVLTVAADRDGLYLALPWWIAVGTPPLHLPWSAVRWSGERRWGPFSRITIVVDGGPSLHLSGRAWRRLDAAHRARLPGVPTVDDRRTTLEGP
jgi:hypothetical protein